jgi:hypothetical protein
MVSKLNLKTSPLRRNDGIYVHVEGMGPSFRFRLGEGEIRQVRAPGQYMWAVDGPIGGCLLQFIPHSVPAPEGTPPIQILASHFQWERRFLHDKLQIDVDEKDVKVTKGPGGGQILMWLNTNPQARPDQNVTAFAAQATLLHDLNYLLHFAVTGTTTDWTEQELGTQALRTAMSYFPA